MWTKPYKLRKLPSKATLEPSPQNRTLSKTCRMSILSAHTATHGPSVRELSRGKTAVWRVVNSHNHTKSCVRTQQCEELCTHTVVWRAVYAHSSVKSCVCTQQCEELYTHTAVSRGVYAHSSVKSCVRTQQCEELCTHTAVWRAVHEQPPLACSKNVACDCCVHVQLFTLLCAYTALHTRGIIILRVMQIERNRNEKRKIIKQTKSLLLPFYTVFSGTASIWRDKCHKNRRVWGVGVGVGVESIKDILSP